MMRIGDKVQGRYEIVSQGPRSQYVLRDTLSDQTREATISESQVVHWHDEVTFIARTSETHHCIIRHLGEVLEVLASGKPEAVRAAWRLLMPECPEKTLNAKLST